MATKQQTADVTKFTGFLAVDGTTHKTSKEAVEHSRNVKLVNQATTLAVKLFSAAEDSPGFSRPVGSIDFAIADADGLTELLIANRDAIIAALTPEVHMRKPRTKKVKAVSGAEGQEAVTTLPAGAPSIPADVLPLGAAAVAA